ncbi:MAG TPA: sugar transferase [Myxococcota bacterium]|nr:sugar transferase [Myxococcota bacterium]
MLRSNAGRFHSLVLVADVALSAATFVGVLAIPGMLQASGGLDSAVRLLVMALVAALGLPAAFESLGLYVSQRRTTLSRMVAQLFSAAALSTALVALTAVAVRAPVEPLFPVACGIAQLAVFAVYRTALFSALHLVRRRGHNFRSVLVVGSGPRARQACRVIESHPEWGLRLIGLVDDCDSPVDGALMGEPIYKFSEVPDLFRNEVIDEVVVACPRSLLPQIGSVIGLCAAVGVPVTILSDLFGDYLPLPRSTSFGSLPALSFAMVHHSHTKLVVKRAIDAVGASALLLLVSPVLAAAAVLIKLSSPGPVFFRQLRCGLYGRRFAMLKLRTMYQDAESRRREVEHLNELTGPVFKIRNDPRITPIGRWLRRWSIDELPQLWNVLRGDMSLVGPRPPIPGEVDQYLTSQRRRLSMRPGLTCLWQVHGRNEIEFEEWVKLDLEYIDSWSLRRDLQILVRTLPAVLRGRGAS